MGVGAKRPRSMLAACVVSPAELKLESVPVPDPGPTQVLFRVQGCPVTGDTVRVLRAGTDSEGRPLAPGEPGRNAWGVVEAVGSRVSGVSPGDRIASSSSRGYAEYDVADEDSLLVLPPGLSDPFEGVTLGGVLNVWERGCVTAAQTVAVLGIGFLGAQLVRLSTLAGARVLAFSRRPFSLSVAREMGAAAVIDARNSDEAEADVRELTDGELCDVAFEATGHASTLALASRLLRRRGTLVLGGRQAEPLSAAHWNGWGQRALGVALAYERSDEERAASMAPALHAVSTGQLQPAHLFTHRFPLEQLLGAVQVVSERPIGFVRALVEP